MVHSTTLSQDTPIFAGYPAYDLFNFNARYVLSEDVSFRFGVDNLFNSAPPLGAYRLNDVQGGRTLPGGSYSFYHNTIGRRFYLGVTAGF